MLAKKEVFKLMLEQMMDAYNAKKNECQSMTAVHDNFVKYGFDGVICELENAVKDLKKDLLSYKEKPHHITELMKHDTSSICKNQQYNEATIVADFRLIAALALMNLTEVEEWFSAAWEGWDEDNPRSEQVTEVKDEHFKPVYHLENAYTYDDSGILSRELTQDEVKNIYKEQTTSELLRKAYIFEDGIRKINKVDLEEQIKKNEADKKVGL